MGSQGGKHADEDHKGLYNTGSKNSFLCNTFKNYFHTNLQNGSNPSFLGLFS